MNPLIKQFKDEKRWCNWKFKTIGDKKTKVPYAITGKPASSTDSFTWSTYEEALNASKNVGIIFTPDQTLLGIDLDKCLNDKGQIQHENGEQIAELLIEADTYTETSVSKTGLHLFLKLSAPLHLIANRNHNFEMYTSGRYFVFTGNSYQEEKEVRTVTPEEATKLLNILGYPFNKKEEADHVAPKNNMIALDDNTVLERMFKSKNGDKIKSLYDGDITAHDKDGSKADMAICSHLAFWCGKNATQMERIWSASPLGSRKKTQTRPDYRDRTIKAAIDNCQEVYETPSMKIEKDNPTLDLLYFVNKEKEKVFIQNTENMCRILRCHPDFQNRLRYDIFKNCIEILPTDNKWRTIEDNDAVNLQTAISILFPCFSKVGKDMVYDALIKVAKENFMDSASDYVKSLKWDGTKRLDTWLSTVYGAPDDVYHRAVASNWLKGLVKRITEPGCKFDYVLVLEGPQGARKSTSLAILGGNWHVETAMSTDTKDFFMQFQGKAIIEFSEGETLSRTEVKRMKAIITMQSDKYRPPYERTSQEFPRRCVFAMTTNQTEYLKDETGNRRWLPVALKVEFANTDWLLANRDQLFAEAYYRIANLKETVYEFPQAETLAAQAARRIHDQNADLVADWYYESLNDENREQGITIHQVYKQAMNGGFSTKIMSKYDEMNIADILKSHLKLINRQTMRNGVRASRWYMEGQKVEVEEKKLVLSEIDTNW